METPKILLPLQKSLENAAESEYADLIENYLNKTVLPNGTPYIKDSSHVIFFYFASYPVKSVKVNGDFSVWEKAEEMSPILPLDAPCNLFHLEMELPSDARIDYKFLIDDAYSEIDPLNPTTIWGGFGLNSEIRMPKFHKTEIEIIVKESDSIEEKGHFIFPIVDWSISDIMVYLPPDYHPSKNYRTVYFADGQEYLDYADPIKTFDYLINIQQVHPFIAVFISPPNRDKRMEWYRCNPNYILYVRKIVKFIDDHFSTIKEPQHRLHCGVSMGGLVSFYVGLECRDLFAQVAAQSGAWEESQTYNIKEKIEKFNASNSLKVWLCAGTFESQYSNHIYPDTQEVETLCKEKGWTVSALYSPEGHSWGLWRWTLPQILRYFFAR